MASIQDLQAQLAELESTTEITRRYELAHLLTEVKAPGLPEALVRLIQRPELVNKRGTFVYCLENFDCRPYFNLLVELIISGNFEVAHNAMDCLDTIEHVSGEDIRRGFAAVEQARAQVDLDDWRRELLGHLSERFD